MLAPSTLDIATRYWAGHLGCVPETLFVEAAGMVTHSPELASYHGVFALFRSDSAIVSVPSSCAVALRALLTGQSVPLVPDSLAAALAPVTACAIGPADIAYATTIAPLTHPARTLGPNDTATRHALQEACAPLEWEHGGSADEHPCSGVFVDGRLASLAGYEIWGGTIAHISIVTHPDFRQRGYGRSAVAHLAQRALLAGLLPQYRTLEANTPSIQIGRSLGFQSYARSLAIRLRPEFPAHPPL